MLAHIGITQQVDAYLLPIIQVIEQFHAYLGDIVNTNRLELTFALAHPQHNQAAFGIGHGTVRRPKILRQRAFAIAPLRQFAFQRHTLTQQRQIIQPGDHQ